MGVENCNAALASLSEPSPSGTRDIDLAVIHKDYISLLSLLHSSATKISLVLKPSSPTYSASLAPLGDISKHLSALSHCAGLFRVDHGTTLIQEVVSVSREVIESIRALLQTFLDPDAQDEYLMRTGAVHHLIDKVRAPNGLSKDNLAAVRKRVSQCQGSLDDGLKEVGEMVEDAESTSDADGSKVEEDGWEEFGFESGAKMNSDELERAKKVTQLKPLYALGLDILNKVYMALRLSVLLHKRIISHILSPSPSSGYRNEAFDVLPSLSAALLEASDELVSTLYTPQHPADVATELTAFQGVVWRLRASLIPLFQNNNIALEGKLGGMSLRGNGEAKDNKKWFDACFDQIDKAAAALRAITEPK